jgi:NADH-quinone oxidoreductase subunit J
MTFQEFLFYLLAGITGLCAIAVVVSQNIVRAAAWLLFTLGGVSGIFFLLGADFIGASQLLIYVGGTLVLVVFGVMLTAQGPFISMKTGLIEWVLSTGVGILLFSVLAFAIVGANLTGGFPRFDDPARPQAAMPGRSDDPEKSRTSEVLGEALLGIAEATPQAKITGIPEKNAPRRRMSYLLPFEIVSVHLLVVLIGAAYLARAKRRRGGAA